MLMVNGYIKAQTVSGGGTDSNGFPIPVTESWGDAIECQYQTNKRNNNGVASAGSAFTLHSYEVLIEINYENIAFVRDVLGVVTQDNNMILLEDGSFLDIAAQRPAKVKLMNIDSEVIDEFMIIATERMPHVDFIKIKV